MDALLSVYGDGRTKHGDGLAALAPASGVALLAGGAPGGGRWPSSSGRVSYGRARGGRCARSGRHTHSGRRVGRRVAGDGRATRYEDGRASGLAPAVLAAGGGRWSGSALRERAGKRTGTAPRRAAATG